MKKYVTSAVFVMALLMLAGVGCSTNKTSTQETSTQEITYKIGDRGPAGGWIFYDKGNSDDGWRYLEAAPEDQGYTIWGCYEISMLGPLGTDIGTGKSNTQVMLERCKEPKNAGKLCTTYRGGGKNDWFLPSKHELMLMYQNLHKNGLGGFSNNLYWSSSYYYNHEGWFQSFETGRQYLDDIRLYHCGVRPIRAF